VFSRRERLLLGLAAIAVAAAVVIQLAGGAADMPRARPGGDIARWKALRQRVNDTQARLREVTMPPSEAAADLLQAAQASGAATGVTIAFARPRPATTTTSSGCLEQALEIQVKGRFPDIARFMFNLEAKHASLRIARVAITSSGDGGDQVNCAITLAGYSPGVTKQWTTSETASHRRAPPR
jgi:hypothetical protein